MLPLHMVSSAAGCQFCHIIVRNVVSIDLLAGPDPNYPSGESCFHNCFSNCQIYSQVVGLCQPAVEDCSNLLKSGSLSGLKSGIHPEYFKVINFLFYSYCTFT